MSDADQSRREDCRREVLRFLAERHLLAHAPRAVRNGVNRQGANYSKDEILSALDLLVGLDLVKSEPDPLGATRYFQATASGVLQNERTP